MYLYGSRPIGATEDAVIDWMKNANNARYVDMLKKDTFPEIV